MSLSKEYTMSKKVNNGMIDSHQKLHAFTPAPCTYDVSPKWKTTILGSMKGGKRNSYIDQIYRHEQVKPSPAPDAFKPSSRIIKKRELYGKVSKSTRIPFTSDSEYMGTATPSAIYIDPLKKSQVKPFKWDLKNKGQTWKVEKKDGPDPQSYPLKEKAFKEVITKSSPKWKQSKGTRKFFTDNAQRAEKDKPGAGTYNTINYDKIHRRLSSKRH